MLRLRVCIRGKELGRTLHYMGVSKAPFPSGSSFSLLDSSLTEDAPDTAVEVAAPAPSAVPTRYLGPPDILEEGWVLALSLTALELRQVRMRNLRVSSGIIETFALAGW